VPKLLRLCGIAGILASDGLTGDDAQAALARMKAALVPRGPDGEGLHVDPPMYLGHRRLAIIDVRGGKQPLYSEDRKTAVVVNGEIYNFQPLRAALERAGHRFVTRSDSEVVVHGYEEWGDRVLERIEGQFALAIWDGRRRRLLLARDRLGEKPLAWAPLPGGGLAFASELKALRHAPGVDTRIDPGSLARYFIYEVVPAPRSILRGARKLEPGTYLVAQARAVPLIRRYWQLSFARHEGEQLSDPDVAAAQLLAELRRSVRERLVSDVPLGVFLSGGVDSSAVAALAAEVRGGDLDTFSIGFDDPSFDESSEARRVARHLGTRHHEERLSPSVVLDLLPAVGRLLDEPLGDGSIVPTHLLARFARRHVTVALGGDGGDELFAGYPTFQAERLAEITLERVPDAVGRAALAVGGRVAAALPVSMGYFSLDFKLRRFLRGASLAGARRHQAWMESLAPAEARGLLSEDAAREADDDLYDVVDRRMAVCPSDDRWDRLLYFYAKGFLGDDVLCKVDRATMAVGLEARAPLLDSQVVALACRLAPALRLHRFETKFILKRALRGLLPAATLRRKKQGFAMPIGKWLRAELRPLLEEDLSERRLREDGLLQPAPIRRLVNEHVAGAADHRKALWSLIAFQRWWSAWREG
jgi:asparagine synthase (glutamine-hydrolysing)